MSLPKTDLGNNETAAASPRMKNRMAQVHATRMMNKKQ